MSGHDYCAAYTRDMTPCTRHGRWLVILRARWGTGRTRSVRLCTQHIRQLQRTRPPKCILTTSGACDATDVVEVRD